MSEERRVVSHSKLNHHKLSKQKTDLDGISDKEQEVVSFFSRSCSFLFQNLEYLVLLAG